MFFTSRYCLCVNELINCRLNKITELFSKLVIWSLGCVCVMYYVLYIPLVYMYMRNDVLVIILYVIRGEGQHGNETLAIVGVSHPNTQVSHLKHLKICQYMPISARHLGRPGHLRDYRYNT